MGVISKEKANMSFFLDFFCDDTHVSEGKLGFDETEWDYVIGWKLYSDGSCLYLVIQMVSH